MLCTKRTNYPTVTCDIFYSPFPSLLISFPLQPRNSKANEYAKSNTNSSDASAALTRTQFRLIENLFNCRIVGKCWFDTYINRPQQYPLSPEKIHFPPDIEVSQLPQLYNISIRRLLRFVLFDEDVVCVCIRRDRWSPRIWTRLINFRI